MPRLEQTDDQGVHKRLTGIALATVVAACGLLTKTPAPPATLTAAPSTTSASTTSPAPPVEEAAAAQCDGAVTFEHPPADLEAVAVLVPFGLMFGSHVTPVDHQYFQNFAEPDRPIEVYSPGAGRVTSIQHFGAPVSEDPQGLVDDFRLVIEHTCTVSSIFIHVDELVPLLAEHDPGIGNHASIDVAVTAGELIGTFTENLDYNLVDLDHTVEGLVDPASYHQEPWKVHVPDTFDYFTSEIRARLEDLSLRRAEPRAGRFAYDVDGRLVGNWFEEGTGGYGGVDPNRYWAGHLSFAYDHLDPTMVVVSIGTFEGRSAQFAVVGNGPDPADISVDSGVILYELVDWDYTVDGERWDRQSRVTGITATPSDVVRGIVAVRLVDQRRLVVEVIPGATPTGFTGFTDEAKLYTR